MKLDGNAVCYLLEQEFDGVDGHAFPRGLRVDFPMLYDERFDTSGHVVLVPDDVRLSPNCGLHDIVCVCFCENAAQAALESGFPVIHMRGPESLQYVYNSMQSNYVRHARLDAQLRAYIDDYAGFRPVIDAFARTMGCSCVLADRRFRIVAQADETDGADSTWATERFDDADIDLYMASSDYRRMRTNRRVFSAPGLSDLFISNLFAENELVGMLAMRHDGTMRGARYARFLLEYLKPIVEEMHDRLGSFDTESEETSSIRSLLEGSFAGNAADAALLERMLAEERGDRLRTYTVLKFERSFTHEGASEFDYLAQRIELTWDNTYCVQSESALFAFADLDAEERRSGLAFPQSLPQFARDTLMKVGMSRPFSSCLQLMAARMQASAALDQGQAEDPTFWLYRFEDYALSWLLAHGSNGKAVEYVAHPAIIALSRYDEEHASDLVRTLRVFMECRYNASEAAARLFVARSTLLNRLARMEEIADVDLSDFDERMYLGISLRLLGS